MAVELKVPQSGESITEVQIGEWRKAVGERVERDEVLVDIETDKAAMELPAPVSGVLAKIVKGAGEEAGVGEVIALINEGADEAEPLEPDATWDRSGMRYFFALADDAEPPTPGKPAEAGSEPPPPAPAGSSPAAPRVMPAAERELAQRGIEAKDVQATGPGGRLLKEDVVRHAGKQPASAPAEAPAPLEAPPQPAPAAVPEAEARPDEEIVAMSPMRKVIARNLVAAQQNAALLTTFNEVDMSAVIALRKNHQEAFTEKYGIKLGFMSFFVKAAVEALKLIPAVNAEIRGTDVVYKNHFDVGIAVGGGKGLVVPVLRNAEAMGFAEIELAIADFARRAQGNKIDLSELQGGTFTISNGGIYGSMLSTPIVNAPQSGILGLHAIKDRPMAVDGQVVVRPVMYLALTYDHRIVDGREAVTFLKHVKEVIEEPVRILIEI
ncbi:MAG: 2-oxoglutarate dehydrogenase complex dihydrolipoyllysine-residue succinyltransferase [Bryobacterales bacterium]|nr:2-oxoglutarate dehydrogenase complex dihydrolipoyllysine-residue succinyltransferase [Bryobacterales bacterium]